MAKLPRISDTEWEIMRIVWNHHPIGANAIVDMLQKNDPTWHPITAKTLMNRLVRKGALGYEHQGRAYMYHPLARERDCVNKESESFLDRVFGGSVKTMVAHFVDQKRLNSGQLRELKKMLDGDIK